MAFWIAIILGLVQGITEFLPISSSGHLVLAESIFGVSLDYTFLNVILHVATLLAVIWFYRKQLGYMITHPFCRMNKYLVIATIPAVVFVLIFNSAIDKYLSSTAMVGVGFLLTALFLVLAQIITAKNKTPKPLSYGSAIVMGVSQAFAIFPGLSRSGTTLAFGLTAGVERQSALDFSFLMSIPIIIASLVYELIFADFSAVNIAQELAPTIVAAVVAFGAAILGLVLMQKVVRKINLWYFVPYLILAGVLTLALL